MDTNLFHCQRQENIKFSKDALGWLEGTVAPSITIIALMVGLGHSLLAMSGFETLAQVYREIAHPKLPNSEEGCAGHYPIRALLYSVGFVLRRDDYPGYRARQVSG